MSVQAVKMPHLWHSCDPALQLNHYVARRKPCIPHNSIFNLSTGICLNVILDAWLTVTILPISILFMIQVICRIQASSNGTYTGHLKADSTFLHRYTTYWQYGADV